MVRFLSKIALAVTLLCIVSLQVLKSPFSSPVVLVFMAAAITLSLSARISFAGSQFSIHARPLSGTLLSKGVYRYIRHPMYTAALSVVWASVSGNPGFLTLGIGFLATGVIITRIITEEEFLRAKYPDYEAYARKTKRLIPFVL